MDAEVLDAKAVAALEPGVSLDVTGGVFYPLDALKPPLRTIVAFSPLTTPIEQARQVLLAGEIPRWDVWIAYTAVAIVVAWLGAAWFRATRKGFADVL